MVRDTVYDIFLFITQPGIGVPDMVHSLLCRLILLNNYVFLDSKYCLIHLIRSRTFTVFLHRN